MHTVKFVYWEEDGAWIGYLQDYPDYWTQGETLDALATTRSFWSWVLAWKYCRLNRASLLRRARLRCSSVLRGIAMCSESYGFLRLRRLITRPPTPPAHPRVQFATVVR